MPTHLDRPYPWPSPVTQVFGNDNPGVEPLGWKYTDGSIGYQSAPGAMQGNWHNGVDIGIPYGTPLHAPADGVVLMADQSSSGFGLRLIIKHGPVMTLYGHESDIVVKANQQVKRGDLISHSGGAPQYPGDPRPGNSTGAHLHWSVIDSATWHYLDPAPFIAAPTPAPKPTPKPAPVDPVHLVSFTVTADSDRPSGGFAGPSERLPKVTDVLPGTVLSCVAWMYGEQKLDKSTGKPDARWFLVKDSNLWVSSARVIGNPAGTNPLPSP